MEANIKEIMAIEFKYLGHAYPEISERIDIPVPTLKHWFESEGRLAQAYKEYAETMNEKRRQKLEGDLFISDEEFYVVSTNLVRKFAQLNLQPRLVPARNKAGDIQFDKEGKPVLVEYIPRMTFADVKRAWEIQRVMRGLPVNYEKQEIDHNIEQEKIIRELGLTDEDFSDENIDATSNKIRDYLRNQ